eukprot:GILK01007678.1.p1 GENE.GILK01007678.1~~GILK01007678.1.p1  ORF type:complete len:1274 (+),score=245.30 GILK01007678.1:36-3824(+)
MADRDVALLATARKDGDVSAILRLSHSIEPLHIPTPLHPWAENPRTVGGLALTQLAAWAYADEHLRSQMLTGEGIRVLISNLRSESAERWENALVVIQNLSEHSVSACHSLLEFGVWAPLLPLLNPSCKEGVVSTALAALTNLCQNDPLTCLGDISFEPVVSSLLPLFSSFSSDTAFESLYLLLTLFRQSVSVSRHTELVGCVQGLGVLDLLSKLHESEDIDLKDTAQEIHDAIYSPSGHGSRSGSRVGTPASRDRPFSAKYRSSPNTAAIDHTLFTPRTSTNTKRLEVLYNPLNEDSAATVSFLPSLSQMHLFPRSKSFVDKSRISRSLTSSPLPRLRPASSQFLRSSLDQGRPKSTTRLADRTYSMSRLSLGSPSALQPLRSVTSGSFRSVLPAPLTHQCLAPYVAHQPLRLVRVGLLGSAGVGKSSLFHAFVHRKPADMTCYDSTTQATQAVIDMPVGSETVCLQVWDTPPQKWTSDAAKSFLKRLDCCLLLVDVTRPLAPAALKSILNSILKQIPHADYQQNFPWILVGTHSDQSDRRAFSQARGQQLAKNLGAVAYIETSSRDMLKVPIPFEILLSKASERKQKLDADYEAKALLAAVAGEAQRQSTVSVEVVLLGSRKSGKTALLGTMLKQPLQPYKKTVKPSAKVRQLPVDGQVVSISMWDLPGSLRYHSESNVYATAEVLVFVFNVCSFKSFNVLENWRKQIAEQHGVGRFKCLLVGTHIDSSPRVVSADLARMYARTCGLDMHYVELSCKTMHGARLVLETLARLKLYGAVAGEIACDSEEVVLLSQEMEDMLAQAAATQHLPPPPAVWTLTAEDVSLCQLPIGTQLSIEHAATDKTVETDTLDETGTADGTTSQPGTLAGEVLQVLGRGHYGHTYLLGVSENRLQVLKVVTAFAHLSADDRHIQISRTLKQLDRYALVPAHPNLVSIGGRYMYELPVDSTVNYSPNDPVGFVSSVVISTDHVTGVSLDQWRWSVGPHCTCPPKGAVSEELKVEPQAESGSEPLAESSVVTNCKECEARFLERVLSVTSQLIESIRHLNQHNLVHGFLSPSKVLVSESDSIKVLGFGYQHTAPLDKNAEGDTQRLETDLQRLGLLILFLFSGSPYPCTSLVEMDRNELKDRLLSPPAGDTTVTAVAMPLSLAELVLSWLHADSSSLDLSQAVETVASVMLQSQSQPVEDITEDKTDTVVAEPLESVQTAASLEGDKWAIAGSPLHDKSESTVKKRRSLLERIFVCGSRGRVKSKYAVPEAPLE